MAFGIFGIGSNPSSAKLLAVKLKCLILANWDYMVILEICDIIGVKKALLAHNNLSIIIIYFMYIINDYKL